MMENFAALFSVVLLCATMTTGRPILHQETFPHFYIGKMGFTRGENFKYQNFSDENIFFFFFFFLQLKNLYIAWESFRNAELRKLAHAIYTFVLVVKKSFDFYIFESPREKTNNLHMRK